MRFLTKTLPILLALLLVLTPAAAAFALLGGWLSQESAIAEPLPPAPLERKALAPGRCPHCGRIDSSRLLRPDAVDTLARSRYEYGVSMADGSRRLFQEDLPVRWRVGEPLVYIDGQAGD